MLVAVVLGNRMNDDGMLSDIMLCRLQLALQLNEKYNPDKIILSGGVANAKAGISEARAMYEWLVSKGVDKDKLVLEDKSLTTKQNVKFSVPIALKLGATQIILCTSPEHMYRKFLNPVKMFQRKLKKYSKITLNTFCSPGD